jgi:small-conductance mechanosensitive channel
VPWRKMHEALIEAAERVEEIMRDPKPFVWQTGLDDFYVGYQLNVYVNDASGPSRILSLLHQNIQDVCNERGIEILSPHYRSQRDGNHVTIPADYLATDYEQPSFKVDMNGDMGRPIKHD